jgi:hypothetical protein
MTLPEIESFLHENGLQFLGFELDPGVLVRYRMQFPDDRAMTALECWHAFERENPDTFRGMYQFFVQKMSRAGA